jgi:hypothetical protein
MADQFQHDLVLGWRSSALAYPEVDEGDSCVKQAFRVRKKGFLYLGEKADSYNAMVKLGASLDEASELAAASPGHYAVGSGGWVTIKLPNDSAPPPGVMERWIDESFRLQAPASLVALLDEGS